MRSAGPSKRGGPAARSRPGAIAAVSAWPLDAAMNAPFEIASGAETEVRNVLVRVSLADGTVGWGEGAPISYKGETQASTLREVGSAGASLVGEDAAGFRPLLERLDERLEGRGAARAALSMALLDAWTRRHGMPLRMLFGGAEDRVRSDVTVTIEPPERAKASARRILALGVRTIKIKVGKDPDEDLERVRAVASVSKGLRLMLDANCGFGPSESVRFLARLKRLGIVPVLFEQPARQGDWKGLAEVRRRGGVPVAADESVQSRADAWRLARERVADVVNIKLMKYGLLEAWEIALLCKAAGLGLMIGGMVESSLAMACAAHFAAGLGGFGFVDLDTPLWFAADPMRGVAIGRGGVYDLASVKAGIGVVPRRAYAL
ncbi:MAG: dipeptide epimerase [Elusimicrobia bacterium]|nr:dipeptide epimerase [Elusimicrobiota bacterium]